MAVQKHRTSDKLLTSSTVLDQTMLSIGTCEQCPDLKNLPTTSSCSDGSACVLMPYQADQNFRINPYFRVVKFLIIEILNFVCCKLYSVNIAIGDSQ